MGKQIESTHSDKIRKFWVSTPKVTGQVNVDSRGRICQTPPIWRRFKGQALFNLTSFLKKTSTVQIEELPSKVRTVSKKQEKDK